MTQNHNQQNQNSGSPNQQGNKQNRNNNQRRDNNQRANFRKNNNRNDFHKKAQRYNSENVGARIVKPKREESIEDIKMDIEKLEKDIQFEIKQIRSVKLGL